MDPSPPAQPAPGVPPPAPPAWPYQPGGSEGPPPPRPMLGPGPKDGEGLSGGAVVGIVIAALVAVGLVIGLAFALVGGDDEGQTDGGTDTSVPETSPPGGSTALEQVFLPIDGFRFVELSADDLETAKREFLATDQFLEVAVEEVAVREFERDGTSVGAAFAVSLDEVLASIPDSAEAFLEGAKEGLGAGGEDVVLAGHPAFSGESEGLPFVVSLRSGVFLFVVGEDRATCEEVMTGILGNLA
jgi:hypothetical protein